ncbi:ATP-binding protein [Streptomyces sp. NPDC047081]|uniref:ATP-binding protein n=1 Tax=Streptomyces sp. NPDC047081 TaxID=3154706 RepID=UPI0033E0FA6C
MIPRTELPYQRDQFYARDRRSAPAARHFTRWTLHYWGLAEWTRADDLLLCVSELVTNALLHGVPPGRRLLFRLKYDGEVVRIEVHDSGTGVPRVADDADEGGRGLLLVSALADKWGVGRRDPGKVVWAEFVRSEDVSRPGSRSTAVCPPSAGNTPEPPRRAASPPSAYR